MYWSLSEIAAAGKWGRRSKEDWKSVKKTFHRPPLTEPSSSRITRCQLPPISGDISPGRGVKMAGDEGVTIGAFSNTPSERTPASEVAGTKVQKKGTM